MDLYSLRAIDVHAHFSLHGAGPDSPSRNRSLSHLLKLYESANIAAGFMTTYEVADGGQSADDANAETLATAESNAPVFAWIVVDPRDLSSYDRAASLLTHKKAVGVKALPLGHGYDLRDYGDALCEFASACGAVLQVQVEGDASFVGRIAARNPETAIILGANNRTGYYEALEKAASGNLFLDLAGGAQSSNMILERLVGRFGSSRILFGTEGLTAPGFIRGRVEYARIAEEDKIAILRTNALTLFRRVEGVNEL